MRVSFDKLRTSLLGGSQSLPGRSRVMNVHPQFFDRYKTLVLEPLISHAGLGCQSTRESPWSFSAKPIVEGCFPEGAQFEEVPDFSARTPTLFPVAHAQSASEPMIDLRDGPVIFRYTWSRVGPSEVLVFRMKEL
jgi:hypothetical protein